MIKRNKGFTLIELIAVLVIMAILALIVTPLVMSIIRKARVSADKRSIDAYGRSIELAIAGYLLDNGTFPTSIEQLTIEYSGEEVVCSTTQLNQDSSVYLAGCTVGGRSVDYTYGTDNSPSYQAYSVGDEITYNGVDYYVIKDSSASEESVTLLKAEPLTVAEVNQYGGVGTANNHVNLYSCYSGETCYHTAYNLNGYGALAYYSDVNCGYATGTNYTDSGCTINYSLSDVKYVVDAWAEAEVSNGLQEARLITIDELKDNLGYNHGDSVDDGKIDVNSEYTPSWVYNSNYSYWTMSDYYNSNFRIWSVSSNGIYGNYVRDGKYDVIRPVIVISKSVL